ncbi:iron ABC transporter permease [Pseudoclavibacter sp. RFBJ3]|uniref:ABC transporter permease n=1 Tax=unclassified Pseudoclavibacter TaxID=2615177 RepID=UPI000CE7765F|nr:MULTISPECIES: iron ABC transporter permease [unclassified Pseudoclavibacter]PPF81405.1 iron ABC transporter permease [Pseudoclavibacter sp. RFBJ5]PPF90736.1 iron ABC transporter permease [Pseudoclavibacter sp. RFBJ3]PPG00633.1 iron ABC transporter permease [Pseudoclavibacter sp. RFBH5]PPG21032.1 iron ABC transporter permease [Pseudoclavibacter sp. RFBI4]
MTLLTTSVGRRPTPSRGRGWRTVASRGRIGVLAAVVIAILVVLVALPLGGLVAATVGERGAGAWGDVFVGRIAGNLFWQPLGNSLLVGLGTGLLSTVIGAFLAWVVVMSDVPGRTIIGALAAVPFALPSFAIALAWETVFRNDRIGGSPGLLQSFGIAVPDALAWGAVPITLTLVAHYFSLSFLVVAAALANVGGDLLAAAELTGASRLHIALRVTLPSVAPALLAGFLLAFAEGVSNFAVPALLGLPVRFQTLSTRLYGSISTGDVERGYVLSILLVVIAAAVLFLGTKATGRGSFATLTGKATRARAVRTGVWRIPLLVAASSLVLVTAIVPGIVLAVSTVLRRTGRVDGGFTLHFWTGGSDPGIAQGVRGILTDPTVITALGGTLALGASVAVGAIVLGVLGAYVLRRLPRARVTSGTISFLSYVPFLIPGVAFGAAFIAQFGTPIGPLPSLYGTFWILILAGVAASVPFAFQTSRAALGQVSSELEEAATVAGARGPRRLARILLPLSARGVVGGGVLVFVTMVRDLSLVVLLVTPATPLLSTMTFRYASEGFTQHANAITLIIAAISVAATLLARRLQGDRNAGSTT